MLQYSSSFNSSEKSEYKSACSTMRDSVGCGLLFVIMSKFVASSALCSNVLRTSEKLLSYDDVLEGLMLNVLLVRSSRVIDVTKNNY
jgi:hypothetical protein